MDEPRLKTKEELRDEINHLRSLLMQAEGLIRTQLWHATEFERRNTTPLLVDIERALKGEKPWTGAG